MKYKFLSIFATMKRLIAISLLGLLLYNSFGYYLLFAYQRQEAREMALVNMPESLFDVVKVKVALYTSVADTDFEQVNEEMTVGNRTYQIVKKRIKNDTAELYYFRDFHQEALRKTLNDIVLSQTQDDQPGHNQPFKHLLKSFIKDYIYDEVFTFSLNPSTETTFVAAALNAAYPSFSTADFHALHAPPPEPIA